MRSPSPPSYPSIPGPVASLYGTNPQAGLEWTAEMFAYLFAGDRSCARAVTLALPHTSSSRRAAHPPRYLGPAGTAACPRPIRLRSFAPLFSLKVVPPVHTTIGPTISVIHFHVKLAINTPTGVVDWFKQFEDAGSKDIWPISPTNQVTDLFATKMHEARAALPPTGYDWKGIGLCRCSARARAFICSCCASGYFARDQ